MADEPRQAVRAGEARVPRRLAAPAFRLFETTSRARGARTFHPAGVTYEGSLRIVPRGPLADVPLFATKGAHGALVRFSRAFGLPPPLPDFLGAAVRLVDAHGPGLHQDLLFATSAPGAAGKYLPLPTTDLFARPFSTLLPYSAGRERVLFGLRAVAGRPWGGSPLDQLHAAAASESLRVELAVAGLLSPWRTVGVLTLASQLPAPASRRLRFNPWNTGGGVVPIGLLNRLRDPAYVGSQRGRPT